MAGKPQKYESSLHIILWETINEQQTISRILKSCPEDAALHRVNTMYLGKILDIRKAIIQERALDKDQLLLDALKSVVDFLIEKREVSSARFIGDHLEEIGLKVKSNWKDSKVCANFLPDTKTSANSSPSRSLHLEKQILPKKEKDNSVPSPNSGSSPKPISPTT